MTSKIVVVPVILGMIFVIAREITRGTTNARGVVFPLRSWSLKVENGDFEELFTQFGVSTGLRRWQGRAGEQVVVELSKRYVPGEHVRAGQKVGFVLFPLAEHRRASISAQLEAAKANLRLLVAGSRREELEIAEAELAIAELLEDQAATSAAVASSLLAKELVSQQEYDAAVSKHAISTKQVDAADAELRLLRTGSTQEEIDALEAEVVSLTSRLRESEAAAETTLIVSPLDGVVGDPETGILLAVHQTDTMLVSVPLDQEKALDVPIGAEARIRCPGGTRGTGRVVAVGQTARLVGNQVTVAVHIVVPMSASLLRPGMTVDARITTRTE
jgi:HlyD family secretion protein